MSQEAENAKSDESSLAAQQAAKAQLRESYLMVINNLSGQSCQILTYEKTMLQATFAAWNPDNQDILVRDLKTPANISINSALLRSSDLLSIQFDTHGTNVF